MKYFVTLRKIDQSKNAKQFEEKTNYQGSK